VSWLRHYHSKLLGRIYDGSSYYHVDKLEALWPAIIGGAIFAAIDIGFGLSSPLRLMLLALLLAPGVLWMLYVTFHELRAVVWKSRRNRDRPESDRGE
jgi:hypothetical protein